MPNQVGLSPEKGRPPPQMGTTAEKPREGEWGPSSVGRPWFEDSDEGGPDPWGKLVADRKAAVAALRKAVVALGAVLTPEVDDYWSLLRFTRARAYDIDKAAEMTAAHLAWRKEFGTDTILEDFEYHERAAFLAVYPQGYHKTDKAGRPIYVQHLGSIDMAQIKQVTNLERMLKFHVQEYERLMNEIAPACSLAKGKQIDQTFAILDVKGVGLKHLSSEVRKVLGEISKLDQDNYPEMLGHTCIINAPLAFRAVWAVVKKMLDARTVAKVELCGTHYMPQLERWIDRANIPSYLGGDSQGTLLDDVGPWNTDKAKAQREARMRAIGKPTKLAADVLSAPIGSGSARIETSIEPKITSEESLEVGMPEGNGPAAAAAARPHVQPAAVKARSAIPISSTSADAGISPAAPQPTSLAARMAELERKMPAVAKKLGVKLPGPPASTSTAPPGTILARMDVLESSMSLLLDAQDAALDRQLSAPETYSRDLPPKSARSQCTCAIM